ncbi:putative sporulation-specific glycosylase YdhD [termite gut metagenome]|uniref:Putative sporulation-specific glycosylase YdhD n=1 Tax=termite gut metagenome TaxID=433724 RepID=A0A5J4SA37_9ZZZZ
MKAVKQLPLFLIICFSGLNLLAQGEDPVYFRHTVEKGQNLYSIANMYGVTQDEIIHLNSTNGNRIYVGQILKIPQQKSTGNKIFHTIQEGETLYRLTLIYQISSKAILDANPGLSINNFQTGKVIIIPFSPTNKNLETTPIQTTPRREQTDIFSPPPPAAVLSRCRQMHRVTKRKETIYDISKEYGISIEELTAVNPDLEDESILEKGDFICIPYPPSPLSQTVSKEKSMESGIVSTTKEQLFNENDTKKEAVGTLKAAIILPFTEIESRSRMVEYYEGFLLAVDSLKRTGLSVELYVYDSGESNASISFLLKQKEMVEMDVIFGPLFSIHIKPLADFALANKIRLVIPFTSKTNEVFNNPYIYQINTPQSYLYSEIYEHFADEFKDANVVIWNVTEQPENDREDEFLNEIKTYLTYEKSFTVQTLNVTKNTNVIKDAFSPTKTNILIPASNSNITLIKLFPLLTATFGKAREVDIRLFGYPEWQTYVKDYIDEYFEWDTYFYSSFYTNHLTPETVKFTENYRKWYSKDMVNTYPKYGILGYDTGFYFLKGLFTYGSEFENNLSNVAFTPLQIGFKFHRVNNWGGFINKNTFFVHFSKDHEIIKTNFE